MVLSNEIRILYLLPHHGDTATPIRCRFHVATIESKPQYEALSYVWGDPGDHLPVFTTDGRPIDVTRNLHSALFWLRLQDRERSLWVDQLCINQWDEEEKLDQIRLMRNIYSTCTCCIFWMGEIPPSISRADAESARELIQYMSQALEIDNLTELAQPACMQSPEAYDATMEALSCLSPNRNEWWTRVWTLQEAILPSTAIFRWGPLSFPWSTMWDAMELWIRAGELVSNNLMGREDAIVKQHFNTFNSFRANLVWLISVRENDGIFYQAFRWRHRHATEPRDNVFGLLGLNSSGTLPLSECCDYHTPVAEVFCCFTLDMIAREHDLLPLIGDPRLDPERATPDMPRWAIDMTALGSKTSLEWGQLHAYWWYSAHGDQTLDLEQLQAYSAQHLKTLRLQGILVDQVEGVVDGLDWVGPIVDRPLEMLLDRLRIWAVAARAYHDGDDTSKDRIPSTEPYPGGEYTRHEAFGRLIIGDLRRNDQRCPERWATSTDIQDALRIVETGTQNPMYQDINFMPMSQSFITTRAGRIGFGHCETLPGDEIWIFRGGRVPFIVRRREGSTDDELNYDFIGWCYVQGIMRGEVFRQEEEGIETPSDRIIYVH